MYNYYNDITEDCYMICNYYAESNNIFIEDDGLHNNRNHPSIYNRMYSNPSLVQSRIYRHQNR